MSTPRPIKHVAPTPLTRDANGRFASGNRGGPGNPFARQVAALRRIILDNVTDEDLLAITLALKARAREGNVAAAKLLLAYAIGKPASAPDPDRLDGAELEHFRNKVQTVQEVHDLAAETEPPLEPRPGPMSSDYAAAERTGALPGEV
jgi:hypothetical protein